MTKHIIQFHASPEELLALANWIAGRFEPKILCTEFPPLKQISVPATALSATFANPKLTTCVFYLGSEHAGEQTTAEDCISLEVARPRDGRLRQSAIGTSSSKSVTLMAWKDIAKFVRAFTVLGVRTTNSSTGESAISKTYRYSKGAKALAESGVVMLPIAGSNVVTFGE
jgi:hypothetical protein